MVEAIWDEMAREKTPWLEQRKRRLGSSDID
jgi:hypothetical protein